MKRILPALAALLTPVSGWAASCVVLAADRDSLAPEEQAAVVVLFDDELRAAGREVTAAPCDEPWELSHTRLGASLTARVSALGRSDKLTVATVEELPAAYDRLVRALIAGKPASENADRDSVLEAQTDPLRVQAETMATLHVGVGALPASSGFGPAFGAGTRIEFDRLAVDLGFDLVVPTSSGPFFIAGQGRLAGLVFLDPEASATPYGGLGFGAGGTGTEDGEFFGPVATAIVGVSLLRETTARVFPQLDFAAPLGAGGAWDPWVQLSVGVAYRPPGWGRRR